MAMEGTTASALITTLPGQRPGPTKTRSHNGKGVEPGVEPGLRPGFPLEPKSPAGVEPGLRPGFLFNLNLPWLRPPDRVKDPVPQRPGPTTVKLWSRVSDPAFLLNPNLPLVWSRVSDPAFLLNPNLPLVWS